MKFGLIFSLALPRPPLSPYLSKAAVSRRHAHVPSMKKHSALPIHAILKASKAVSMAAKKVQHYRHALPAEPFNVIDLLSDSESQTFLTPESESVVLIWTPSESTARVAGYNRASALHVVATAIVAPSPSKGLFAPQHAITSVSVQSHLAAFLDKLVGLGAQGRGIMQPLSFIPTDVTPLAPVRKLENMLRYPAFSVLNAPSPFATITEHVMVREATLSAATQTVLLDQSKHSFLSGLYASVSVATVSDGRCSFITARSGVNLSQSYTRYVAEPSLKASATASTGAKQSFVTASSVGDWSLAHSTSAFCGICPN